MSILTNDQQTEILLAHGLHVHEWETPGPTEYWSDVFHWIKRRWPGLVTCASYAYVLNNWKDRFDAEADMLVLTEIHSHHRDLQHGIKQTD